MNTNGLERLTEPGVRYAGECCASHTGVRDEASVIAVLHERGSGEDRFFQYFSLHQAHADAEFASAAGDVLHEGEVHVLIDEGVDFRFILHD